MIMKLVYMTLPILAAAACAPVQDRVATPPTMAPALVENRVAAPGPVTIWRGVKVLAGGNHIDWTKNSFGVSGNPATLSFFDAQGVGQQCWLRVTAQAPDTPVLPGGGGLVTVTVPAPPPVIGPSPWPATFDNDPPGHWSITKQTITNGANVSNAAASTYAGAVFRASTVVGQVGIVDGTVVGCQL